MMPRSCAWFLLVLSLLFVSTIAIDVTRRTRSRVQTSATASAFTVCRGDGRDPVAIAKANGFCPKKSILAKSTITSFYTQFKSHKYWNDFWNQHKDKNFAHVVSTSSNCGTDTGIAPPNYVYKITLQMEDIDEGTKATATTVGASNVVFFRGVAQAGNNYEWDTFNCIPLDAVKEVSTLEYIEDPNNKGQKIPKKKDQGGGYSYTAWETINWDDKKYTKGKAAVVPADGSQAEADFDATNVFGLTDSYTKGGKVCKSQNECFPLMPRCCKWGKAATARCFTVAGKKGDDACEDVKPANNAVVFCKNHDECRPNKEFKNCCLVPDTKLARCMKDIMGCKAVPKDFVLENPANPN